jgi:hypothetical protein
MMDATVESIFGTKAGIIWNALNQNGPSNISNLVKATSLSREEICGGLGWLGREDKIIVEVQGRAMIFSLRESERRWQAVNHTVVEDFVIEEQTTYTGKVPAENASEARKIKAPALNAEAIIRALAFVLSEFEANREPTPTQVSSAVGMDRRQLGKAFSKLDIKSETVYRDGKNAKIYPLALRARVWELAALDADGLQKMVEARAKAMANGGPNKERFTVFD